MRAFSAEQTDELLARYRVGTHLSKVRKFLSFSTRKQVAMLRSHDERPKGYIDDAEEIAFRDSIDSALEMVGVLEVVAIATGSTPAIRPKVEDQLRSLLGSSPIREYYEVIYPVALPKLFFARMNNELPKAYGQSMLSTENAPESEAFSLLIGFIELDARRSESKPLALFLDLLDDYRFDDLGLDSVLRILDGPSDLEKVLFGTSRDTAIEREAIRGLGDFIQFCKDYKHLLQREGVEPVVASAIWIHNSYWFGSASEPAIRRAAKKIEKLQMNVFYSPGGPPSLDVVRNLEAVFSWLTDWRARSHPIVSASRPLLDQWVRAQKAQ